MQSRQECRPLSSIPRSTELILNIYELCWLGMPCRYRWQYFKWNLLSTENLYADVSDLGWPWRRHQRDLGVCHDEYIILACAVNPLAGGSYRTSLSELGYLSLLPDHSAIGCVGNKREIFLLTYNSSEIHPGTFDGCTETINKLLPLELKCKILAISYIICDNAAAIRKL